MSTFFLMEKEIFALRTRIKELDNLIEQKNNHITSQEKTIDVFRSALKKGQDD